MQPSSSRKPLALLALAALCFSVTAPQPARADGDEMKANAAGAGVARISYIQGAVAVQRGDSPNATAAAINAPVLGADYVNTGQDGRAEIQFDGNTSVRLASGVQMRFTHLDTGDRELQLAEGTIELRLLRGVDGRTQVDTPSVSVRPRAAGAYRVSVDSDGRTYVTVRAGSAEIVTPQATRVLASGTTLLAQGAAANPALQELGSAIAFDDFDTFNGARDERELRALADAAYVAPGVPGVDDLDTYGRWVTDTSYGHVWVPNHVASDWAPYRDGRWVWEDSFGWTWLGYEPWGWAPYHYGRWYHRPLYGWCWYPDPFVTAWRPALVGFFTFGFNFGNIGWVALGPLEPLNPWWGNGFGRTTIVNVTNVTNNYYYNNANVAKVFGNARYRGVTYVPRHDFLAGIFQHRATSAPDRMRSVQIVRGVVPLVPTAANLRYSDRTVPGSLAVRPALLQRAFAGNAAPVRRMPFEQQRVELAKLAHPAAVTPVVVTNRRDPWARFGTSRGVPETSRAAPAHVTVIDGTAGGKALGESGRGSAPANVTRTAHDAQVWSRFDTSAPPVSGRMRTTETVRPNETLRSNEPVRTYAAPAPRGYDAPRQSQPAQYQAPPARTTTTTGTPHAQQSQPSHSESRSTGGNPHH